jgi:hypothetical protein
MQGQGSGSNIRQCANTQHGPHQRFQGPLGQMNHGQYPQRNPFQHQRQLNQQTPWQGTSNNTPMKTSVLGTPNVCYNYSEPSHYANYCPKKRNQQTPQKQNSHQKPAPNAGRVNHVSAETASVEPEVMLGTFMFIPLPPLFFLILGLHILSFLKLLLKHIVYVP